MILKNQIFHSLVHTLTHKRKSPGPIPHIFSCTSLKTVCNDWNKDHTMFPLDNGGEEQKSGLWQVQYFIPSLAYSADSVIKLPHLKTPFLQVWKKAASQICEMSSCQNCFLKETGQTVICLQNRRCVLLLSCRGDLGPLFHFQSFICPDHWDAKFVRGTEKQFLLYVKNTAQWHYLKWGNVSI